MRRRRLTGGGIDGNEQLTAMAGVVLLVLLAVLGVTIVRIGQLIWLHLFLGLVLVVPVLLKLASTGYRFARYYLRDALYRSKGPPVLTLRAIGPLVVATTLVVFATGVALLFLGPRDRSLVLLLHKASFIAWLVFMVAHVLGHLPGLLPSLRAVRLGAGQSVGRGDAGAAGRWIVLVSALVAGAVLALALLPEFHVWTAAGAIGHHHER